MGFSKTRETVYRDIAICCGIIAAYLVTPPWVWVIAGIAGLAWLGRKR